MGLILRPGANGLRARPEHVESPLGPDLGMSSRPGVFHTGRLDPVRDVERSPGVYTSLLEDRAGLYEYPEHHAKACPPLLSRFPVFKT